VREGLTRGPRARADDIYREDITFRDPRNAFRGKRCGARSPRCRAVSRGAPSTAGCGCAGGWCRAEGDRGDHTDRHADFVAARRNYRILFWSLRFHGRLFFRALYVDVQRIWQPAGEDQQIRCAPCCLARLKRHIPG